MDTKNLMAEINKKALAMEAEKQAKHQQVMNELEELTCEVSAHGDDIADLCSVAQYCLDCSIDIGETFSKVLSGKVPENYFYTDSIYHGVGFIVKNSKITGFGLLAGGCMGDVNLEFDINGNLLEPLPNRYILETFLRGIVQFKERFNNYIMGLNK